MEKIYLEEYTLEEDILKDFLKIIAEANFLFCDENDLENILSKYQNKKIYVQIKKLMVDLKKPTLKNQRI